MAARDGDGPQALRAAGATRDRFLVVDADARRIARVRVERTDS